jgi:enoyl-[acyl-carrier protein] reductase II
MTTVTHPHPAFDNRVSRHLGVDIPIIQAPMGWIARSQLASAVSRAGACGIIETSSGELDAIKDEIRAMRELTDRPFGVNIAQAFVRDPAIAEFVIDQGVKFVTTSAGSPTKYTGILKEAGLTVYHVVPTLAAAVKAVDAGVDGLVVEGGEGGGFKSPTPVATMVLLPLVRERLDVPIIAAGGIIDGRTMAAAFALGAEGVTMGTRFVASLESPVHQNYKQAIVDAPITGTILTDNPPRARSRGLRTPYSVGVKEGTRERLQGRGTLDMLYVNGDVENTSGSAGESAGLIHEIKPVRQIIDDTIAGFWREIDRLAALRPQAGAQRKTG